MNLFELLSGLVKDPSTKPNLFFDFIPYWESQAKLCFLGDRQCTNNKWIAGH